MKKPLVKDWYKSKTLMVNTVLLLGVVAQVLSKVQLPIDPELQSVVVVIVNYALRVATKEKLKFK